MCVHTKKIVFINEVGLLVSLFNKYLKSKYGFDFLMLLQLMIIYYSFHTNTFLGERKLFFSQFKSVWNADTQLEVNMGNIIFHVDLTDVFL